MNIKDLLEYNWYSRRRILKSMTELPWEQVTKSCGASFDSIRDIFVHSLQSEQFWIRLLSGKKVEGIFDTNFSKFVNINTIKEYADEVEAETSEYKKILTEEILQNIFEFKGRDSKTNQNKIEDVLMHVIEEEIHHRGELLCIYWQNNFQPPYTSYMNYVNSKNQA